MVEKTMITLSTTVYEKDFKFVLDKQSWFYRHQSPLVTKKNIIINNIKNVNEFLELKKSLKTNLNFFILRNLSIKLIKHLMCLCILMKNHIIIQYNIIPTL